MNYVRHYVGEKITEIDRLVKGTQNQLFPILLNEIDKENLLRLYTHQDRYSTSGQRKLILFQQVLYLQDMIIKNLRELSKKIIKECEDSNNFSSSSCGNSSNIASTCITLIAMKLGTWLKVESATKGHPQWVGNPDCMFTIEPIFHR